LKIALIETGVEVGPAIYLARVFDTDVDSVVKFFILVLIFVFDPMAVIFVISYNVTLLNHKKASPVNTDSDITTKKRWPVYGEKEQLDLKQGVELIPDTDDLPEIEETKIERTPNVHKGGVSGR
jgi:hypothetical protein